MSEATAPNPTSAGTTVAKDVRRFACPGCGATLVYAAGISRLHCEYCDTDQEIPRDGATGAGPIERALEELLSGKFERGWGTETLSFECKSCGASVTLPPGQSAGRCPFCDNDVVVQRPPDPNLIRPESLIPFRVDKKAAGVAFSDWLGKLWFRPNNLKKMARLSDIKGVYSPFWTFDAQASSRWSAESGYYYYETEYYTDSEGKQQSREVQHTRWEPSCGSHSDFHNDVLICASSLVEELVRDLEPFSTTTDLVPYRPEFLSGWMVEEYKVEPPDGWKRGEGRIMQREYEACESEVPGDTHRNLNVSTRLDAITWKHVLLPVWIAAYRYNGKIFRFMVNGETGKVSGEAPISWYKVIALIAFIIAAIAVYVNYSN